MDHCSEIARLLVEFANSLPFNGNNMKWKANIFGILGKRGRELGFEVCHGPCGGAFPGSIEYLWDFIWRSNTGGIELAAEFEQGSPTKVLEDFRKLLDVKSPIKVMIYTVSRSKDTDKDIRIRMEGYMAKYPRHVVGERYLFVEFGAGNVHRCYLYVVPNDGTVGSVSLSPLPIQLRQPG